MNIEQKNMSDMRIDFFSDAATFAKVRESIVGHPEKEIRWNDLDAAGGVSFAVCRHNSKTMEVYACDRNGWCDANMPEVMDAAGVSHDKGFAKTLKRQGARDVTEKLTALLGKDDAVVYGDGEL